MPMNLSPLPCAVPTIRKKRIADNISVTVTVDEYLGQKRGLTDVSDEIRVSDRYHMDVV